MRQFKKCLPVLFSVLIGCEGGGIGGYGGGGGGSDGGNTDDVVPVDKKDLRPLGMKFAYESMPNKEGNTTSIDYVDLQKVGAHPHFRLTFINTNPVAVKSPNFVAADGNWVNAQALKMPGGNGSKLTPTSEQLELVYQKIPAINKFVIRDTKNKDDCRTYKKILQPQESCSLYLMGMWAPNFNNETNEVPVPIGYQLQPAPEAEQSYSGGSVRQCKHDDPSSETYKCRPDTDDSLFIKFKMTPFKPAGDADLGADYISLDGKYAYRDKHEYREKDTYARVTIVQRSINADMKKGISFVGEPLNTFTQYESLSNPIHIPQIMSNDGSKYWLQYYDNNELKPIYFDGANLHPYDGIPHSTDVGMGASSSKDLIVAGLDGSTWVNLVDNQPNYYGTDSYDNKNDKFEFTNVPWVYAVDDNRTVIGRDKLGGPFNTKYGCWTKPDKAKATEYMFQEMANYVGFPSHEFFDTFKNKSYNAVYLPMIIPKVHSVINNMAVGLFKVHTKDVNGNPACYIDLEDYVVIPSNRENNTDDYAKVSNTKKFTTIYHPDGRTVGSLEASAIVDPTNVYLGK
jgi:hypothetical protein